MLTLINQHRAGLGEVQLQTSPTLTASAVWKARHMAAFNYFAHDDPGPPTAPTPARSAADRVATCGYTASWGGNIATGFPDAASAVNAWLGSPGHRANIENPSFVATGIGVARSATSGALYWVEDFGVVADGGSPPPPPPPTTTTTPPPPSTTAPPPTTTSAPAPTTTSGTGGSGPAPTAPPAREKSTASSRPAAWSIAPVRLHISARRLVLSTAVSTRGHGALRSAAVKCSARIGSRRLRVVVNAYRSGVAHCAWRLPRHRRADVVSRGWVRVRDGARHVRRRFVVRLA